MARPPLAWIVIIETPSLAASQRGMGNRVRNIVKFQIKKHLAALLDDLAHQRRARPP